MPAASAAHTLSLTAHDPDTPAGAAPDGGHALPVRRRSPEPTRPRSFEDGTMAVVPLADDDRGPTFDPRSAYAERFWLSTLGPTTLWLARRLVAGFDDQPDGYLLDLAETSISLGLGDGQGRHSPFNRALGRLVHFHLAEQRTDGVLAVRPRLPVLQRRQVVRLPGPLQIEHLHLVGDLSPSGDADRQRLACRLALGLQMLGEEPETIEQRLWAWGFEASMASEAVAWSAAHLDWCSAEDDDPLDEPERGADSRQSVA